MLRRFLPVLAACLLTGTLAGQGTTPNIIFILTDDLGPGDLGVLWQDGRSGTQKFDTPHLDTFAAQGIRLTRHYCPAPVCAPSRASLLLGVHQGHANVRDNQFDKELEDNHTLGSVLQQAGYATANIGKWGLHGGASAPGHPLNRGFDYFFGYLEHGDAHRHYPTETGMNLYDGFTDVGTKLDKCYSTDLWTARAKDWITTHHTTNPTQPFFLYLAYTAPHARLDVPTQAYPAGGGTSGGMQWLGYDSNPATPTINTASGTIDSWIHPDYSSTTWPDYAKRHATMIRRIDDSVADLIALLDDLNLDDDTLIVFSSDNGTHNEAGSGGSYTYNPTFFDTFGPYDGIKRDLWEGGVRMATLARWPGTIPANSISNAASQFHDWMPTFCELAEIPQPERSDGVSLVPTLTGLGTQRPGLVYSEYNYSGSTPNYSEFEPAHRSATRNQMQFVHIGDYKGLRYNTQNSSTTFQVYNTVTDPKETTDLAGQPGVPTQQQFSDRVLQIRRSGGGVTRPYDSSPVPPSSSVPFLAAGLEYRTYEGSYPWVPDLETEAHLGGGNVTTPDLSVRTRDDDFGLLFSGWIEVPTTGAWTFTLTTDTGAFIRLHDAQLIDADNNYASGSAASSGSIQLEAGKHPISIHYIHGTSASRTFNLQWSGPGVSQQTVPAAAYFRTGILTPTSPAANDDSGIDVTTGSSTLIDVLANDTDPDGLPQPLQITAVTTPAHGLAMIESGAIRYTPTGPYLGPDTFSYTISDGQTTDDATVSLEVVAQLAPIANDDSGFLASTGSSVLIEVLANDSDPDEFPQAIHITAVTAPAHGSATIESGAIRYTPVGPYLGPDTFSYTISDGLATDDATVSLEVVAQLAPLGNDDSAITTGSNSGPGSQVSIAVLANDSDPDSGPSSLGIASPGNPHGGTVVTSGSNILYTPKQGFFGTDSFVYTLTDGAATATALVTVEVTVGGPNYWYALNESTGLIATEAGGGKTASLLGFTNNPAQWVAGRNGRALSFDGGDDYLSIDGFKGIAGTNPRTVSAWIKTTGSGQHPVIAWGPNSSGQKWTFLVQGNNIRIEVTGGFLQGRSTVNDGNWHHVACSWEDDTSPDVTDAKLYVDGVLETTFNASQSRAIATLATIDARIGRDVQDRPFPGLIDDARIHSSALSAAQIATFASETPENNDGNLWFYRNLGNDAPTTADWNLDGDSDGYSNFTAYALGGSPHFFEPAMLPKIEPSGNDYVFIFNRRSALAPSRYIPEWSQTLQPPWFPLSGATAAPHPEFPGFEEVSVPVTSAGFTRKFVHLLIN